MGIDVYFKRENIHTKSEQGELMLTLLASFAQAEAEATSENVKWRVKEQFKEGKTALYIRARDEAAFEELLEKYTEIAKNGGAFELVGVYSDIGKSGLDFDREGLNKLIDDAKQGKFTIVTTPSITHFGRNTAGVMRLVQTLRDCGVNVRFDKENVCTGDKQGEFMTMALQMASQNDKED